MIGNYSKCPNHLFISYNMSQLDSYILQNLNQLHLVNIFRNACLAFLSLGVGTCSDDWQHTIIDEGKYDILLCQCLSVDMLSSMSMFTIFWIFTPHRSIKMVLSVFLICIRHNRMFCNFKILLNMCDWFYTFLTYLIYLMSEKFW